MRAILAVGPQYEIGYTDGQLAYRSRKDMQFFKAMTYGCTVIAGRKTAETIPGGLKGRRCLCLCRDLPPDGWLKFDRDIHEASESTWVIGGAQTVDYLLDAITEMILCRYPDSPRTQDGLIRLSDSTQEWIRAARAFRAIEQDGYAIDRLVKND
jgi:dihydrofolate reductase